MSLDKIINSKRQIIADYERVYGLLQRAEFNRDYHLSNLRLGYQTNDDYFKSACSIVASLSIQVVRFRKMLAKYEAMILEC